MRTKEELQEFCGTYCDDRGNISDVNFTVCKAVDMADCKLYPKTMFELGALVPVTIFFLLILLAGILGNLSVCTVILKHPSMRTETNFYLFSLAISDILLLVFGFVPELWEYWQRYPYTFGLFVCRTTKFVASTGTWASALTVVAFSIERYTAICLQLDCRTRKTKRITIALVLIWAISIVVNLPIFHVFHIDMILTYPRDINDVETMEPSPESAYCMIPSDDQYKYYTDYLYIVTAIIFFFIPMLIISVMYIKIALFIRSNGRLARESGIENNCSENARIFRVLVAVVVAFFVCGLPYHVQRIFAREIQKKDQGIAFVITACFFYLSATINPILYNAISEKYQKAFKELLPGAMRLKRRVQINAAAKDRNSSSNKSTSTTMTNNTYTTLN